MKHTRVQRRRQTKRKGSRKGTRKHRKQQGGQHGVCQARCPYGNGVHDFGPAMHQPSSIPGTNPNRYIQYCNKCNCHQVFFMPVRM